VERDIAVVVPEATGAGQVEAVIREFGGQHLRGVTLFDQYRGAPLADDEKSVAYRLRFEFVDGDQGDEVVDPAVEQLVTVLSERLGARLRS
jgi:phenylalanyl-tRNA synthetase beta chain